MLTGASRSIAQVRGFGGIGKSLLVEEYALRFGAAYPGGIFWLRAQGTSEKGNLQPEDIEAEREREIRSIAAAVGVQIKDRSIVEISASLGEALASRGGSLWIVDNLGSKLSGDALSAWLSPCSAVPTLITTRDRGHRSLGFLLDLDMLSSRMHSNYSPLTLLFQNQINQPRWELVNVLGRHALAVEVAASYLEFRAGSVSFEEFIASVRDPSQDVLELAAKLSDALSQDHSPSISATVRTSVSQLSDVAADFLLLASVVANGSDPGRTYHRCLRASPQPRP